MHKKFIYVLCIASLVPAASVHGAEKSWLFTPELDHYLRVTYAAIKKDMDHAREQAKQNSSQLRAVNPCRISLPCAPDPIVTAFQSIEQDKEAQSQEKAS